MAEVWNGLLSALGSALSFFYNAVPSYVVAIMLLTVAVRVLMLPLTIKQTRSMQAMQKLQPQIKELQRKHKGNRQKLNEEMMKLYKEHQVNPLGGCLPLLLQLPVFFALYRVLTSAAPGLLPGTRYLPAGSQLVADIGARKAGFLGINLACSPVQAGSGMVELQQGTVNCGDSWVVALPIYILVALMVFTTFYQQRQMQRASSGPQQAQMQLMGRIMPVFLGVISINISAGVLIYWVTTNLWQVGQQYLMLRSRPEADSGQAAERAKPRPSGDGSPRGKQPSPARPQPKPGKAGGTGKKSGGKNARGRKKRSKR